MQRLHFRFNTILKETFLYALYTLTFLGLLAFSSTLACRLWNHSLTAQKGANVFDHRQTTTWKMNAAVYCIVPRCSKDKATVIHQESHSYLHKAISRMWHLLLGTKAVKLTICYWEFKGAICVVKIRSAASSPKGHLATETDTVQYVHKLNTLQPILLLLKLSFTLIS